MQWKMNQKSASIDINLSEKINLENSNLENDHKISRWSRIKTEYGIVQNDSKMSEAVQAVMDSKIISDSCLNILKNDESVKDPTIIMNLRHEQTKEKNLTPRFGWDIDIIAEAKSIMRKEKIEEQQHKREMAIIERELLKFREELKQQKKQNQPIKLRSCKNTDLPWNDNEFWTQLPAPASSKEKTRSKIMSPRRYRSLEILQNRNKSVRFGTAIVIDDKNKSQPNLEAKVVDKPEILKLELENKENLFQSAEEIIECNHFNENSSVAMLDEIITENDCEYFNKDAGSLKIKSVSLKPNAELCITAKNIENAFEKQQSNKNLEDVLKKNFLEWRRIVHTLKNRRNAEQKQKEDNIKKESNINKVDSFLSKIKQRKYQLNHFSKSSETLIENTIDLKMKKKPISAPSQIQYQNRFKAQEHIIALQKAKLADQERLIRVLKFKNIVAETKESNKTACTDIKETIKNVSKNLKPKTLGLQTEVQTLAKEVEAPLQIISQSVPQFLQHMNARAAQRAQRHREANERRKHRELMKKREKEELEEARRQEDIQEKLKRIEDLKQKRRQEKLMQIQLEKDRQLYKEKCAKADLHNRLYLLEKFGIRPFRKLLTLKYDNIMRADLHYNNYLIRKCLQEWKRISMEINMWKLAKANQLNEFRLQRLAFNCWKQYHFACLSNKMVAEDWSNLQLSQRTLRTWSTATKLKKEERAIKYETAKIHERRQLLWRTLDKWRLFPSLNQIDRLREKRKEKWRHKVWEILPDYKPIKDI